MVTKDSTGELTIGHHRPAPAHHRIHLILTVPREFYGVHAVTFDAPIVDNPADGAELEVAALASLKRDTYRRLHVEILRIVRIHVPDAPCPKEWIAQRCMA